MLTFLLLACTADTADVTVEDPPGCGLGFERGEDGYCYEVDGDTADPTDADTDTDTDTDTDSDTDTDTDTDTDSDTDSDTDTDSGPVDTDGDGYLDPSDCDEGDATVNPAAADDQDDDIDNDCDGDVDEDFDACAAPYGWAEWTSTTFYPDEGVGGGVSVDGPAQLCAVECDAWWVSVDSYTDNLCPGSMTLPAAAEDLYLCWDVTDPGVTYEEATCTAYTSAGYIDLTVVWN